MFFSPPVERLTIAILLVAGFEPILAPLFAQEPGATLPDSAFFPELTVTTVEELAAAIGPRRTLRLAPGVYNLSQLPSAEHPYLLWDTVHDGRAPVIAAVEDLTLRGPIKGVARLEVNPRYAPVLTLRDVRRVTIEGLVLGHSEAPGTCGGGVLRVQDSQQITIRKTVLFGSGTEGLTLERTHDGRFEHLTIRDTTEGWMTLAGAKNLRFLGCQWRAGAWSSDGQRPGFIVRGSSDIEMSGGRWEVEPGVRPMPTAGQVLAADHTSSVRIVGVELVDSITRESDALDTELPVPAASTSSEAAERSPPWRLVIGTEDRSNEGLRSVAVALGDGREVPLPWPLDVTEANRTGLHRESVQVRSLGSEGLVAITGESVSEGAGGYSNGFVRVVGPTPDAPILLDQKISLSGHSGWNDSMLGDFSLRYRDRILELRIASTRSRLLERTEDEPRPPLYHAWRLEGEAEVDLCCWSSSISTLEIRRWHWRGQAPLEPLSRNLYYKVQEGDTATDVSELFIRLSAHPVSKSAVEIPLPVPGAWLKLTLPPEP